jgi:hypothetical protein
MIDVEDDDLLLGGKLAPITNEIGFIEPYDLAEMRQSPRHPLLKKAVQELTVGTRSARPLRRPQCFCHLDGLPEPTARQRIGSCTQEARRGTVRPMDNGEILIIIAIIGAMLLAFALTRAELLAP